MVGGNYKCKATKVSVCKVGSPFINTWLQGFSFNKKILILLGRRTPASVRKSKTKVALTIFLGKLTKF